MKNGIKHYWMFDEKMNFVKESVVKHLFTFHSLWHSVLVNGGHTVKVQYIDQWFMVVVLIFLRE